MKLPKNIQICGRTVPIHAAPTRADGSYNMTDKVITVGTRAREEVSEILVHEALEAILYERGLRYCAYSEGSAGIRFVMSHEDFENFVKDVVAALHNIRL